MRNHHTQQSLPSELGNQLGGDGALPAAIKDEAQGKPRGILFQLGPDGGKERLGGSFWCLIQAGKQHRPQGVLFAQLGGGGGQQLHRFLLGQVQGASIRPLGQVHQGVNLHPLFQPRGTKVVQGVKGAQTAPRPGEGGVKIEVFALIKGGAIGPRLEKDGIEPGLLRQSQHLLQPGLQLLLRKAGGRGKIRAVSSSH